MTNRSLFLTGASGFVGRRLLRALADQTDEPWDVGCLVRDPDALSGVSGAVPVRGDLLEPGAWQAELAGCDIVLHLAALTGKARTDEYARVNVEGTRNLISACEEAGVPRLLFVSTIAVEFPETKHYPYATSKAEAEECVRASGLDWLIARPTIVLGKDSPAWGSLSSLAKLPLIPLFGGGASRIQPIDVDDLARWLLRLCGLPRFDGLTIDLGGPEVLSFEDFLVRTARAFGREKPRTMALPARLMIRMLSAVEGLLLPVLPLTAGQLYPFVHDSTTGEGGEPFAMLDVDAMLARYAR